MTIKEIQRQAIKAARKVTRKDLEETIEFYKPTAQEMFGKLGYTKDFTISDEIRYVYDEDGSFRIVAFNKISKSFACYYSPDGEAFRIETDLHKAINKQCKELGWL